MKIAYFGSPSFSATLLEKLILDKSLGIEIALVVTQPDKPVGRKMIMTPSPVKVVAQKYGIGVIDSIEELKANSFKLKAVDLALVYAFGFKQLIPLDLLRAPKMQFEIGEGKTSGFVNVHPSLLPLYRGSSPIAYPLLLGENKTGVTLFVMDEKMDHGPIIDQQETEITLTDVRPDMEKRLTDLGFKMVKNFLNSLICYPSTSLRVRSQVQNHLLATRSPYMTKQDGFIPFSVLKKALNNEQLTFEELPQIMRKYVEKYNLKQAKGADSSTWHARPPTISTQSTHTSLLHVREDVPERKNEQNLLQKNYLGNSPKIIYDFWRGMSPWPGLWTIIQPPRFDSVQKDRTENTQPPRFDSVQKDRTSEVNMAGKRLKIIDMEYHVQTGHAPSLHIKTVQLEGKSPVDFPTFQKAYQIFE